MNTQLNINSIKLPNKRSNFTKVGPHGEHHVYTSLHGWATRQVNFNYKDSEINLSHQKNASYKSDQSTITWLKHDYSFFSWYLLKHHF